VRVCYFGTYDPAFARNALLIAGLRRAGVDVVECRVPLWRDTADKLAAARGDPRSFAPRLAAAWRELARRHRALGDYDVLVVGYAGHLDVLLARHLARARGRPVVLDAFLSLAETVADRGLAAPGSLRWQAARLVDRLACRRADRVLVDTRPHAAYLARAAGLPPARLAVVPMGAWPRQPLPMPDGPGLEVLYFGGYIPLHGLDYVLGAAERLADLADLRFSLVGDGQEFARIRDLVHARALRNVCLVRQWLSEDALVEQHLRRADVCLGVFGGSAKAARVVPAKVLLALAAGRPVVTRTSPAAREALRDGENALLCAPADAAALAAALRRLHGDPALRARLAAAGPPLVSSRHGPAALGRTLRAILERVTLDRGSGSPALC
jgi:glycosyltransferase involved in cell wall biosynthesis